jgi:hypothetical protein
MGLTSGFTGRQVECEAMGLAWHHTQTGSQQPSLSIRRLQVTDGAMFNALLEVQQ